MKFKLSCGLVLLLGLFNCLPIEEKKCEEVLLQEVFQAVQSNHLNTRPLDDQLSKDFFGFYLAQLDSKKEFFTQKDIALLQRWESLLDEELTQNKLDFFNESLELLQAGIERSEKYGTQALSTDFDFSRKEKIETDAKKLAFATDEKAMQDRWRKKIKQQLLEAFWLSEKDLAEWSNSEEKEKAIFRLKATHKEDFREKKQMTRKEYLEHYVNTFLKIHDFQSVYLSPEEKARWTAAFTRSYVGIGVGLEMEKGHPKITKVMIGGPAWKVKKVAVGDVVLAIGANGKEQVEVAEMKMDEVLGLLKGKEGTEVNLSLKKSNGELADVSILRSKIASDLALSLVLEKKENQEKMGYLRLPRFYAGEEGAAAHVLKELRYLKNNQVDGIVLDLRNNIGGSSYETNQILGYFLEEGPLMQSKNMDGDIRLYEDEDPDVVYDGPLVVLVNGRSASGSELFAGTVQDYRRGVIVGSPATFGKGSMQRFLDLEGQEEDCPLGEVKMSIARFYTAGGRSPQYTGIIPDIILPDDYALVASGERKVQFALPPENLPLEKVSQDVYSIPELGKLKRSSTQRVSESYRFQFAQLKAQAIKDQEEQSQVALDAPSFVAAKTAKKERADSFQQIFMPIDGFHAYSAKTKSETIDSIRMFKEVEMKNRVLQDPYVEECFFILQEMTS